VKTTIYYFTGTGNSLTVAKDLAGELESSELIPIAGLMDRDAISVESERVGFVFPVYMWGMPLIVKDFVEKLSLPESAYVFGIATCGSSAGKTLVQLNKLLKRKGSGLSTGFVVRMPGNYTPMYGALSDEKQEKIFAQEKQRIPEIAAIIEAGKATEIESGFFLLNALFGLIYKVGSSKIPGMDEKFWVDENCTGCGICVKVCPVDNIQLEDEKPHWLHRCQQCLACLQWCPQEAIQSGKKTPGRRRYQHRAVKMSEIIGQRAGEST